MLEPHRRFFRSSAIVRFVFVVTAGTALWPRTASADCGDSTVSTCINADTFWPRPGNADFPSIGSTLRVARGSLGAGLVASYQSRPMVIRSPSPGPTGSDQYVVDNQVNGTFLFSYGVTQHLELGLAVPVTFIQDGGGASPLSGGKSVSDTAMRDLRFGGAYTLIERPVTGDYADEGAHAGLAALFEVAAPTGDRDSYAGDRTAVFIPAIVADLQWKRFLFAAEIGGRLRSTSQLAGTRIGSQAAVALGSSVDLLDRDLFRLGFEVRALPTLTEQADWAQNGTSTPNGKTIIPAEWSVFARSSPLLSGALSILASGGGALPVTGDVPATVPRFRFTLGVRFAPPTKRTEPSPATDAPVGTSNAAAPSTASPSSSSPTDTAAPSIPAKPESTP